MPEAVAFAIEAFAAAAGTEMTLTAAQIYFASQAIVYTAAYAASSAYSSQQRRKAQASAQAAYLAGLKDRELMIRSAVAPRRVIYGRDKVSGPIVYAQSTGSKGEFLHLVIALAAHECDAIETIYFNDVALPDPDGNGDITSGDFGHSTLHTATESVSAASSITLAHDPVSVLSASITSNDGYGSVDAPLTVGQYSVAGRTITFSPGVAAYSVNYTWSEVTPRVRIRKHLGGAGQTADSALVAASGGKWTEQHRGTGICYLYVRLEFDTEVFGQVGLPAISAVVRGRKVRDPRSGLVAWSDNAALCVADWLRDTSIGLRASASEVPDSEVIAAANICDETVATSASTSQPRYNFNGSFTTQQAPRDVLADLLSGMAGHCVWSQGRWLVRAGAARAAALTINADKLAGSGVSIVPKASRTELFNAVRVTYRDPAQAWAEVQAPLVTNATYEAADGGVRIVRSIQLPGAMDAMRAQRLGKIELERERQALTVQLTTNLAAYDLAPTDTCYLDLDRYGFASKLMEVRQRTWSPDGTLAYTVRETAAGVFAWAYGEATALDLAPDTTLPSPYTKPAALTGLSVQSGTNHLMRLGDGTITARAWVQWAVSTDAFVVGGGVIEAQWKRLSFNDWQVVPSMPGDAINTYMQPVPDGTAILVRVRAVNASGRASDWAVVTHQVVGKTAAPGDVAGLSATVVQGGVRIAWTPSTEIDHADTDLRIGATWSSATALFRGTSNTYTWPWPAAGTYTLSAKHRDSTGNVSATAATVTVTVDAAMLVQWANVGGASKPADTDLLNTHTQGSVLVVNHPAGGNFAANLPGQYGAIKIRLPQSWSSTMLRFYVEIYEYQSGAGGGFSSTYEVGGYNYGDGAQWINCYARMVGTPAAQRTVRFGHDGTYCCVWIGDPASVWEYPQVIVSNLRAGYGNYAESQWKTGWAVSLDASAIAGHAITSTESSPLTGASWPLIAGTGRPADNATVGAIWGGNLTGQPSDAELLNVNQTWAQVSGSGKPADNATKNTVFQGATTPSNPQNNDTWVRNDLNPVVAYTYQGGTWVLTANYVSNTNQISDGANLGGTATWGGVASKPAETDLLNTHTQGSVLVVNHPAGGNFAANLPGQYGAIKIRLPQSWSSTMLRFYVEIYEYQSGAGGGFSSTYEVGGYNYGDGAQWINCYARMVGTPAAQRTVRFGHDGTYCCVWIGDPASVWEYPQVIVSNLRAGYGNYAESQWKTGWAVSLDASAIAGHAITSTESSPLTGASWPLIAGTGRPADNATVNRVTYSGSAPGSPVDGDLWMDTSVSPYVIKARVSGAWQAGANLSTGALAQLNSVDTGQIAAGAATAVAKDQGGSGDVGNNPGAGATNANVVVRSVSYTNTTAAAVDVQIESGLTDSGLSWNGSYPTGTTTATIEWSSASLSGSIVLCSKWPDSAVTSHTIAPAGAYLVSLPAGETLTALLRMIVVHSAEALIGFSSSRVVLTAIKR